MNNCPKCGNPLQEGTTSCPICGTNIVETKTAEVASVAVPVPPAEEKKEEPKPAPETKPVEEKKEEPAKAAPAPEKKEAEAKTDSAPVEAAPAAKPAEPAPAEPPKEESKPAEAPAEAAKPAEPAPAEKPAEPAAPTEAAPAPAAQPAAPVEASQAPAAPAAPVEQPATQPAAQPAAPVATATPAPAEAAQPAVAQPAEGGIAPTVNRVEMPTPVPGIPSSLSEQTISINPDQPLVANPKLAPKKKPKKSVIIGASILGVLIIAGILTMVLMPGKSNKKGTNNQGTQSELSMSSMASNGYHLKLAEGWQINEDGNNVVITNSDSTVAMKLDHSEANLGAVTQEQIEDAMRSNSSYQNVEVNNISISGRSSYLVSTNINDIPVEIYFINGGTNLVLGATIVYQSNETKSKYESSVTEMIGTLSYSEDSIKAIETISQYSTMFKAYGTVASIIPRSEQQQINTDVPEVPEENNDYNDYNDYDEDEDNNNETPDEGGDYASNQGEGGNTTNDAPIAEADVPNNPET